MAIQYSMDIYKKLENAFEKTALFRPMRIKHYMAGTELEYRITGVQESKEAIIRLVVDKFVGGGFAGQVYRVRILEVLPGSDKIDGIAPGNILAIKILIPPSFFSKMFRNIIYWLGFQAPFQHQVNPDAAMSGAVWQKFIRRGAKIELGDENAVVDVYAIFVDNRIGSCGEIREWVEGRTWRLEVDPYLDFLRLWRRKKSVPVQKLASPEYRAKYEFMHRFVNLLHAMGAYEFARQYEWWTCKSQPNCLKRTGTDAAPDKGLVAVDFRAGLALLPFLPMSPGDFILIFKGLLRGSLVQFDRGSLRKLEQFIDSHVAEFADLIPMLERLKACEAIYRNSVPDITHNHIRLIYSKNLWTTLFHSTVSGWRIRNLIDEKHRDQFIDHKILIVLFNILGFIPFFGSFFRRIWGQPFWRRHYFSLVSSPNYRKRAICGKLFEKIMDWYQDGRITDDRAEKFMDNLWPCLYHLPLSVLPAGLHRFLSDFSFAKEKLDYLFLRPIRLYFRADLRAQWLNDMVKEGKKKHILTDEDADIILSQVKEPFIQKYLQSLAVHICTLPITQIVSVLIAVIYIVTHPEMPRAEAYAIGISIIALFQVVPVSPGSLTRGLYVLYLVIREKNFKDYNIAVFLGFFKYIGYLAFPIQMTYRYPALARFMAGHWATDAVHIMPVFGERGALLEHFVYRLFYNWPLTIRRRMEERKEIRSSQKSRFWHLPLVISAGTALFWLMNFIHIKQFQILSPLKEIWWLAILIPALSGAACTLGAGGAAMWKRVVSGAVTGSLIAFFQTLLFVWLGYSGAMSVGDICINGVWKVFAYTIFSAIGVLLVELSLPGEKV